MALGELGCLPISCEIDKRALCYWLRLCQGKKTKLSHTLYLLQRKLYESGDYNVNKPNWCHYIKNTLDKCGLSNVWHAPNDISFNWFKKCIALRLNDQARQNLLAEIDRNRLCFNYRMFKTNCEFEKYLITLDNPDLIILAKFRCGNCRLPANDIRSLDNNLLKNCLKCDLNEVGDEFHYLFVCPALSVTILLYIKPYYYVRPNALKFCQLMNSEDKKELIKLSKFIKLIVQSM